MELDCQSPSVSGLLRRGLPRSHGWLQFRAHGRHLYMQLASHCTATETYHEPTAPWLTTHTPRPSMLKSLLIALQQHPGPLIGIVLLHGSKIERHGGRRSSTKLEMIRWPAVHAKNRLAHARTSLGLHRITRNAVCAPPVTEARLNCDRSFQLCPEREECEPSLACAHGSYPSVTRERRHALYLLSPEAPLLCGISRLLAG